jgi:hypothetical protein
MPDPPAAHAWPRLPQRIVIAVALLCAAVTLSRCEHLFQCRLPARLAGMPLTLSHRDGPGLEEIRRLHGANVDVRSGAFAAYGGGAASVWVASARDTAVAEKLIRDMTARIARGDTPFRPDSVRGMEQRSVYELTGLGQRHFYFRSGRCVVWVAANRRQAAAGLDDALRFYR